MYYDDIRVSEQFIKDYNTAPSHVMEAVDKLIRIILDSHALPNSMAAHKVASAYHNLWIGYITRTKEHYRLLFHTEGSVVVFDRIFKHDVMDTYLKELVKS